MIAERDGKLIFANPAAMAMFGLTDEAQYLGRDLLDFVVPEARHRLRALRSGPLPSDRLEVVALRADGIPFDLEVAPVPLHLDGEPATGVTLRDVTETKRVREAIRRHQARYRLLFERNLAGVYRSTPDGRMLECNDAFARIFGYDDATEACAEPALAFHESAATREEFVARLRARKSLQNYEVRGRRKDGGGVWILENVVLFDDDGLEVIEGTVVDLTERKRAERRLSESEARYRSIFDFATVGIYQAREDGSLRTVNRTLARLLGYDSPEEVQRLSLDRLSFDTSGTGSAPEPGDGSETVRWRRRDGTPIWVEIDRHTVRNPEGRALYLEGFVHDVTARRRAEEERSDLQKQLAQAQKMEAIGQLAGGVAHDFNNILTAIAGYTDLLIGSLPPGDKRRPHAEEIQKAGERAASLTRQLLAFSRRQLLEPKVLDLNEVVAGMEEMLQRVIGEHIRLRTKTSPAIGHVRADPGQIEQAILNLVLNARDAMGEGGDLTIETGEFTAEDPESGHAVPAGSYCMLAVSDTGAGMGPEVRARLFEPFFTTKEVGKGDGLGLSTTYGIVRQSGGYIWCDSEPGRGATFRIVLPRVDQPLDRRAPDAAAPVHRSLERILLVEDEPEVRLLLQKILKMHGYEVIAAASPEEALAIERHLSDRLDLMITDVVMPGMTGRRLADRMRALRPEMRVLFVSGYTDNAIVHEGILQPGTDFLQKPFTPAALARKVREVLDGRDGAKSAGA